jgi:HEAT repeats
VIEELEILREQARTAAARGDHATAVTALLSAASKTHANDRDYDDVLRPLADGLAKTNDPRRALTVVEALASNNPSEWRRAKALLPLVPPVDRARALAAQGYSAEAAREAEGAGLVASAAFLREAGGEWTDARALWARLASRGGTRPAGGAVLDEGERMYVAALVQFNLARCARQCQDAAQLREATVASVRLLEEAADHFESIGQRERAFDCFQVLAQIGRDGGAFEDVLEGFVNSIRILREDHLKHFALQNYDEAIGAAAERGEAGAAATLAREAAAYARSLGLAPLASGYTVRQAELWRMSARRSADRGAPPEIAENALLAAILAFGEEGQAARVGAVYGDLAALDLVPTRREHYRRAASRYAKAKDAPLKAPGLSHHPGARATAPFNEVWRVDVLEWERAGQASEACAEVMLDLRFPEFMRRRAMLARLTALEAERVEGDRGPAAERLRVRLASELAQVQLYVILSPLEHLFAQASKHAERRVQLAVLAAMETLVFKRSFATVRAGLADPDPAVVGQAVRALSAFQFEHAFDPLARLVRESPNPDARAAALRTLVHIDTTDAAELLLGVLEHGSRAERTVAVEALKKGAGTKFGELARQVLSQPVGPSTTELRAVLRDILAHRPPH